MKVKITKFENGENPIWVIGFTELPNNNPPFFVNLEKEGMQNLEKAILDAGYTESNS